ncbi:MAG: tetratricopeptide repeat protein [Blastocatellia bacterium]|nr:tetratricopeptide repeat protein [Blastocatellia bacterium]
MQKTLLIGAVCLVAGMLIGFFGANSLNRDYSAANHPAMGDAATQTAGAGVPSQPGGMMPDIAELLEKADREPENFATQMKTGDLYAQIGRFDRAIEFYKRGIALNPDDVRANLVIANAYFDSGQWDLAASHYEKVLAETPDDLNARTDLGSTFVERQQPDYERALQEFSTVLEKEPKHEPSLYYLGVTYHRKGDTEKANETLEKLIAANPASELVGRLRQNIAAK